MSERKNQEQYKCTRYRLAICWPTSQTQFSQLITTYVIPAIQIACPPYWIGSKVTCPAPLKGKMTRMDVAACGVSRKAADNFRPSAIGSLTAWGETGPTQTFPLLVRLYSGLHRKNHPSWVKVVKVPREEKTLKTSQPWNPRMPVSRIRRNEEK